MSAFRDTLFRSRTRPAVDQFLLPLPLIVKPPQFASFQEEPPDILKRGPAMKSPIFPDKKFKITTFQANFRASSNKFVISYLKSKGIYGNGRTWSKLET